MSMNLQDKWETARTSYDHKGCIPHEQLQDELAIATAFRLFNYLGEGATVLDLGCGNGKINDKPYEHYGYSYIDPVHTIYGCDVINYPDYPGKQFVIGNAEALPFEDNLFNAVCIKSALDHILNPDKMFKESIRVLKPHGSLFICQAIFHEYPGMVKSRHPHHIYDYSIAAIVQLYQYGGYVIRRIKVASQYIWMFEGVKPNA